MTGSFPPLAKVRALVHDWLDETDALAMAAYGSDLHVDRKDDGTPVTDADRGVERLLRERITAAFPGHAILGEEEGLSRPVDGGPCWVLDPIDGTRNFTARIPVWATLVALLVDDTEVLGVVSAPALHTRWDGIVGEEARHDGRPVTVSATDALAEAALSFGGLGYFWDAGLGEGTQALVAAAARTRGFGDFWQHCLVASGRIDAALEATVSRWDLAAVRAVVVAAGGRFTDLDGNDTSDGGSACSSNGRVHDAVLATLRGPSSTTAGSADAPATG